MHRLTPEDLPPPENNRDPLPFMNSNHTSCLGSPYSSTKGPLIGVHNDDAALYSLSCMPSHLGHTGPRPAVVEVTTAFFHEQYNYDAIDRILLDACFPSVRAKYSFPFLCWYPKSCSQVHAVW